MSATILISTGARLHFGFFAHAGGSVRLRLGALNYGGIGLMIDSPGFVLAASGDVHENLDPPRLATGQERGESGLYEVACNLKNARAAESDPFAGPPVEAWQELGARALKFIRLYRTRSTGDRPLRYCNLELWSAVPSHRGLGAGTQLGMAVAKALSLLAGDSDVELLTLAHRVGRGARSAIGIHGFGCGGFLVDAGKECDELIGRLEARVDVPADWRFLLINPPDAAAGLSGKEESAALSQLPATSNEMTERLRRLALTEMLPALTSSDCDRFGEAVFEFGRTVGNYFGPIQGGIYSTPQSAELVEWIRREGFRGVAQTSWGPTLAVCCADRTSAQSLREKLEADPRWRACATHVAAALNSGARIQTISSGEAD
jgi:beta-ribofuranosylaminobenzene 5'-phosphate synthase